MGYRSKSKTITKTKRKRGRKLFDDGNNTKSNRKNKKRKICKQNEQILSCPLCTDSSINDIESKDSKITALKFINGVYTAYGVPIYNNEYYACAEFEIEDAFPMDEFGELLIAFGCKSDLMITRDTRRIGGRRNRQRQIIKKDEAPCQFKKGCQDNDYRALFKCFTKNEDEMMFIDLGRIYKNYASNGAKAVRGKRPFVIFESGFGGKEEMKERLYLMLRLYLKYATWAVVDLQNRYPPWFKKSNIIVQRNKNRITIDLTAAQ